MSKNFKRREQRTAIFFFKKGKNHRDIHLFGRNRISVNLSWTLTIPQQVIYIYDDSDRFSIYWNILRR